MTEKNLIKLRIILLISLFLTLTLPIYAQESIQNSQKNNFWKQVRFGGNLGIGIGNNLTNIVIGPSAIYQINSIFATGVGIQYNYLHQKNLLKSNMYGVNLLGLVTPIELLQLSIELEQLRIHNEFLGISPTIKKDFWNTGLFIGAGYHQANITVGIRYNVLFSEKDFVYNQA